MPLLSGTSTMRTFFAEGKTLSITFRKQQLEKLKQAILKHEESLYTALYTDLKKSREEAYVTELGLVLTELRVMIKHMGKWARPRRAGTNLVNLPSSSYTIAEPKGVVFIIATWNYPFQLLFNPLVGAIAAGNCVVLKGSEHAPATDAVMKQLIEETFEPHYISYIQGDGATVVPQVIETTPIDHIFYTGSTAVGRKVYEMAAPHLIPVTLELGGKSPCVVLPDADMRVTARRIASIKFSNAGQMCVTPDYILVHELCKGNLIEELRKAIAAFYSTEPQHSEAYGKIINERQFDRLMSLMQAGTIVHGGAEDRSSLYIEPTLITGVNVQDAVMQQEIFGPLLPILTFNTREEALRIIETHANPLAFYVFTANGETAREWIQSVPSGGACINNCSWHLLNHNLPFGGRGNSGMGNYHGKYSFEAFSHTKAVMRTPTWFDPAMKYPPFAGKLNLLKKIIR